MRQIVFASTDFSNALQQGYVAAAAPARVSKIARIRNDVLLEGRRC